MHLGVVAIRYDDHRAGTWWVTATPLSTMSRARRFRLQDIGDAIKPFYGLPPASGSARCSPPHPGGR